MTPTSPTLSPAPLLRGLLLGVLTAAAGCQGCLTAADCTFDSECAEGEVCAEGDDGVRSCATICDAFAPCADGYNCVPTETGAACLPTVGQGQLGDPCEAATDCTEGACIRQGSRAACTLVCDDEGGCPDGARCYVMGVDRVCLAPFDSRAAGEACTTPLECESTFCVAGLDPNADPETTGATCVEACTPALFCEGDLGCVEVQSGAHVCVPLRADGETCTNPDVCEGGRCITDDDGTRLCTQACEFDCDAGWACVPAESGGRVCMPLLDDKPAGEPCEGSRECADAYCVNFGSFGPLCAQECPQDGCPDGQVCWDVQDQPDACGPG